MDIKKIPSHLAYVAILPCETLMSAKQAINDKLQGSVATHLRCGRVGGVAQWYSGTVVERRSLAGELSLSCA